MTGPLRRAAVRVAAMAGKEVLHIVRDPRTLVLALVMPVALLVVFGYGISYDVTAAPLLVQDADGTAASRAFVRGLTAAGEFAVAARGTPEEAERLVRRGEISGALVLRRGFGRDLDRGDASAQLVLDGSDATIAMQLLNRADALSRATAARLAAPPGAPAAAPLELRSVLLYNPGARSAVFVVPGMTGYVMALVAVLLTALAIAGEWERGSMEQLFASPVGRFEIVAGKLLPYLALGLVQLLLVVAVGSAAFDVPLRGSAALLVVFGGTFLAAMLGQGLLISVVAKNQLVATQAGTLSAFVPSLLLSGAFFPIDNMPLLLRTLSRAIPARYLVHALRGILLKGSGLAVLWPDLLALALFAATVVALATLRFQRRLA